VIGGPGREVEQLLRLELGHRLAFPRFRRGSGLLAHAWTQVQMLKCWRPAISPCLDVVQKLQRKNFVGLGGRVLVGRGEGGQGAGVGHPEVDSVKMLS
jgi:hypothetical protein